MDTTRLRRSLAVVVTAVAGLIAFAHPAAAAVHTSQITSGSSTLTKTGVTETLSFGSTTSCSGTTMQIDLGTETVGASVSVTALSQSHVQPYSSGSYLTVLTRSTTGNTAGTLGGSTGTHTLSTFRVAIVSTIYNTTSCTPTGTPVCTVAILFALSGTSTSTTVGNTFSLTGSSVFTTVAFPTCTAGPSQILGTTSTTTTPITGTLA